MALAVSNVFHAWLLCCGQLATYSKISYLNNLESENIKLKLELDKLKTINMNLSLLQQENQEFRKILNVAELIDTKYITAKIVGINITPFASTAILQAGSASGIEIDDIVRYSDGLIGRIANVSEHYSTVMLATDPNSRIPVITEKSQERGIIAKQGDDLKLIYLNDEHKIQVGELIYTSGDGKIYTNGLLVAVVEKVNDQGVFIKITSNLNDIKFVIVESKLGQDLYNE
jgi:rod shape-determining protein MreC